MKRIIFIAIIFVALITLATIEVISVNNVIKHLEIETTEIQSQIEYNKEDVSVVFNKVENIKNYWNKYENKLCLIFNHKDLSTITDSLNKLSSYVENNDYDNAFVESNLLVEYATKSKHVMGFNLQNLF